MMTHLFRFVIVCMAVGAVSLWSLSSRADEGATDEEVRTWLAAGEKDYAAGRYADAENWFEKAYAARPNYDVAANLAAAELKQNKRAEAATHIRTALDGWPITADAELKAVWEKKLAAAEAAVGRLRIETTPGATVTIDGSVMGEAPFSADLFVEPGKHRLEARLEERVGPLVEVTIDAGIVKTVRLVIPAPTSTVPHDEGWSLVPGWVAGAVGVVGIAVGIGLYVAASGERADAMTLSDGILADGGGCLPNVTLGFEPRCTALGDKTSGITALEDGGTAALAVGGTLTVGAILYLLLAPSGDEPNRSGLSLRVDVGSDAGVSLYGSF